MNERKALPQRRRYEGFFLLPLGFAVATLWYSTLLGILEIVFLICGYVVLESMLKKRNEDILDYMKNREKDIESATRGTIVNAPLPMVIFQPESDEIIWSNQRFLEMTGKPEHLFDTSLSEVVPSFKSRWLTEGKIAGPEPVIIGEETYKVYGNLIEGDMAVIYWVNITQYAWIEDKFQRSRPVAMVLLVDNYDELMRSIDESERSVLRSELNRWVGQWSDAAQGILCRYDRDHFLVIVEEEEFLELQRQKFQVLEWVRQVRSPNEITATLSIGIGRDAPDMTSLFDYATSSMEMALARGGDQIVIREGDKFQFFGGRAKEMERRTKIKSRVVANTLSELMGNASKIYIMGHKYPDLDVSGAEAGIFAICRKKGIPAIILKDPNENPASVMYERLAAQPEYAGVFVLEEEALEFMDEHTLLIVVDTNRPEQVQCPAILEKANRVVVIDHHRRAATYIENPILSFEDPYASSASELAAELMQYMLEPGDFIPQEAEAVLAGIVLDTKNFTMRTGGRTFEIASYLRRFGAETGEVKKLFQSNLEETIARYAVVQKAQMYREGISLAVAENQIDRITGAKSADDLINIASIEASFVLFMGADGYVMVSARSVGDVNVQLILEDLGGGGNAASAGAKLEVTDILVAEAQVKSAIDKYFDEE